MNRYSKYRALVALAAHGSFSRAADVLQLSQPALTRAIQALEAAVGAPLVIRNPGRIALTELGELVADRAQILLAKDSDLNQQVFRLASLEQGQLRFGAGPYPTLLMVPELLSQMTRRYPGLEIAFEIEGWRLITQRVKEGHLELVITDAVDAERDQELKVARLRARPMYLVARHDHPLAGRRKLSTDDIAPYPLATTSLPARVEKQLHRLLKDQWPPSLSCDDVSVLMQYTAQTNALSFLPPGVLAKSEDLVALDFVSDLPDTRWGIIRLAHRTLSPAAQILMETIRAIDRELEG